MERIASGGMGEVYLARITRGEAFQKIVAVKKLLPELSDNPVFLKQFENEARFAARLNHANIVSVYDYGTMGGVAFLAMEYVEGVDLASLIDYMLKDEKSTIPLIDALSIASSVAAGLDYLHRLKGKNGEELHLVHQDISPQNILVSTEGEAKITDFGLIRAIKRSGHPLEGKLIGKLAYMAPEQILGKQIDKRVDIFALGCVLFEMLTGRLIFGEFAHTTNINERNAKLEESLRQIEGTIPDGVFEVLEKTLRIDPNERFEDARKVYDRIRIELARLEAEGTTPDPGALVRRCPATTKGMHNYLDPSRTIVATMPIARAQEPSSSSTQSNQTNTTASRTQRPKPIVGPKLALGIGIASAVAALIISIAVWWYLIPDGTLVLTGLPPDAELLIDGKRTTHGAEDAEIPVYGHTDEHTLIVRKQYFLPYSRRFSFKDSDRVQIDINLRPMLGSIRIDTEPAGAAVWMNEKRMEKTTPLSIEDVPLGRRITMRMELAGFVPFRASYVLTDTKPLHIHHKFEPLSLSATVHTEPEDVKLFVNGSEVLGKSPFTLERLEPGKTYTIEAFRRGFLPYRQEFVPQKGKKNELLLRLKPARLNVSLHPPRGFVAAVDGKRLNANSFLLSPNKARLVVLSDPKGRKVVFRMSLKFKGSLRPRPIIEMNINSNPWTEIQIDSGKKTSVPIARLILKRGTHIITFRFAGKGQPYKLRLSF